MEELQAVKTEHLIPIINVFIIIGRVEVDLITYGSILKSESKHRFGW